MKKRIALLLSFVLVLSLALCACGGNKATVVGTWKTDINLVDMLNQEMEAAGMGVAMGNAKDTVKESADYVTSSVDDDGIKKALEYFKVL